MFLEGLLFVGAVVGGFLCLCGIAYGIFGEGNFGARVVVLFICAGALGLLVGHVMGEEEKEKSKGPCIREKTGVQYDPATKTSRTYKYCAERGKWDE